MKTIICEALRQGSEIECLIKMAATNNAGKTIITPNDVKGYLNVRSAIYAGIPQNWAGQPQLIPEEYTMEIGDNEGVYMILTWQQKKEESLHEAHAGALNNIIS